ncbi:MAG: hypothetical protein R3195_11190, partial [Gemmatimonadota bacterium]|nr:hypothetical protein [Gemmatimonadota bacterium]
ALARLAFVVAAGLAVGLATALVLNRVVGSLLYGVSGADPLTLGGVGLGLATAALAAAYLPARRAGRADPVRVLDAD